MDWIGLTVSDDWALNNLWNAWMIPLDVISSFCANNMHLPKQINNELCANLHLPKQMWDTLEDKYASRPLKAMIAVFIRCLFSALHRHKTYFFLIKDCFQVIREAWTRLHSTGTIWMNEFGCLGVSGGEPKKTGNKKEKNINNLYFEIF